MATPNVPSTSAQTLPVTSKLFSSQLAEQIDRLFAHDDMYKPHKYDGIQNVDEWPYYMASFY